LDISSIKFFYKNFIDTSSDDEASDDTIVLTVASILIHDHNEQEAISKVQVLGEETWGHFGP
jgi:hypothetical protein